MMKLLSVLIVAVLAGCGGGGDVAKMKKVKDQVCACTTMECVKKVEKENEALSKSLEAKYKDLSDIPKEMFEVMMEIEKCEESIGKKSGGEKGEKPGADKPSGDPPANKDEEGVKALTGFKDAICACKDKDCVGKVQDQMDGWEKANGRRVTESHSATKEIDAKLSAMWAEIGTCVQKLNPPE